MSAASGVRGTIVRSAVRGGVVATETRYPADALLGEHRHDHAYVSVLIGGAYTEVSARETRLCRGVTAIFHPAGEVHADHFGESGRCVNVELAPDAANRLAELGFAIDERAPLAESAALAAARFLRDGCDASPHAGVAVDDLLVEIAAATVYRERGGSAPRWFGDVLREMAGALDEPLSVADFAARIGVHPTHLAREFRRRLGCCPAEYRRRLRFESAARFLRRTRIPVADVAQSTGFADQSHLARTFKAWSGMSPSAYRQRFGIPASTML